MEQILPPTNLVLHQVPSTFNIRVKFVSYPRAERRSKLILGEKSRTPLENDLVLMIVSSNIHYCEGLTNMLNQTRRSRKLRFAFLFSVSALSSIALCNPAHAAQFNVKNYGAKGNGTTDDSQAIANAIAAANASPGSTVLFPAGTYFIGPASPVLTPKSITLLGAANATLEFGSTGYISASGKSPSVQNLNIVNDGSLSNYALQIGNGATNYSVLQNTFKGWSEDVYLTGAAGGKINANSFNTSGTGISASVTGNLTVSTNSFVGTGNAAEFINIQNDPNTVVVSGNSFKNAQYGVFATSNGSGSLTCSSNTFSNCTYSTSVFNFQHYNFNTNVVNNSSYGTYDYNNDLVSITGNTINAPTYAGVYSFGDLGNVTISGNTVKNAADDYGICAEYCYNVSITGNTVSGANGGAAQYLVYAYYNSNNVTISQNTLSSGIYGIFSEENYNLTIGKNTISHMQYPGIVDYLTHNNETINANNLKNCVLAFSTGFNAVIWLESAPSGVYNITNNTYVGSTSYLTYFINANGSGNPQLHGNTTNTMLPDNPPQ